MHVALVSPAFPHPRGGVYVGIERHAVELGRNLVQRGHRVSVFTTYWNDGRETEELDGMMIYRTRDLSDVFGPTAALFDLHYFSWGWNLLAYREALGDCDVIHALAPLASTKAFTSRGAALVTHFHHFERVEQPTDLLFRPFHHRTERKAYRASTLVVTPSRSSSRDLSAYFDIPLTKIRIVPHAINPSSLAASSGNHAGKPVQILFVGEHETRKGLNYLLQSIRLLRQSGLDARLVTVGHGSRMGELQDLAISLGIDEVVEFKGYVVDLDNVRLPRIYSEADIFVLPSLLEGFGFVLLEAMASGLPIVGTNVSAVPEVLGDAGLLVPPGNPSALAEALHRLAEDPQLRSELGRRGRSRVEALFTWDKVVPEYLRIYQEAMDTASRDTASSGR